MTLLPRQRFFTISRFQFVLAMCANWDAAFLRLDELGLDVGYLGMSQLLSMCMEETHWGHSTGGIQKVTFLRFAWFGGQEK